MSNKAMMNTLLKRCNEVYEQCGGKDEKKKDEMVAEKGADAYEKLKVDIVNLLKRTRQDLKEKDDLEKRESNSSGVIKLKNSINKSLKKLEADHTQLKSLVNPKRRLGKKMDEAELAKRNEEVELVGKHISEVRDCMRAAYRKTDPDDPDLGPSTRNNRQQLDLDKLPVHDPTKSALPEIDISAGLAELDKKQKIIDDALDEVSKGLDRLGQHAQNFSTTMDTQNAMIDEATKKAEQSTDKLKALNVKLEDTIKTVGAQKYIMFAIIIVVIAVVVGIILLVAQQMFF